MNQHQDSISALRKAFSEARLPREEYWTRMRDLHRSLFEYSDLLADSELDRIEVNAAGIEVVFDDGIRMRWDPEDLRSIPNTFVNHGAFESEEARILAAIGAQSRTVLDIGANAGLMALRIARAGTATIHAFEPVPSTYAELEHNVRRNGFDGRIHCHQIALGDRAGEIEFYIPQIHGSVAASARALFPDGKNARVQVQMERLDSIVADYGIHSIDLIKCDVEGAEIFVLRGGWDTLCQNEPILMLELLQKWARVYDYHPNDVIAMLGRRGYRAFVVRAEQFVEISEVNDQTEATNFFFFTDRHEAQRDAAALTLESD